jgi:hypothetical protein
MMSAMMSAMLSASLSRAAHPYLAVDELSDPLAVALDELSRDQWRSSRAEAVCSAVSSSAVSDSAVSGSAALSC